MVLKKWKDIPETIKNEETYTYYKKLEKRKISLIVKRVFDIVVSLILLIIMSPIFIILALFIKLDSKGPVFYKQERVTQYNRNFKIFKFRTMVVNADKIGSLITLGDDSRITRIGKIIRKFRLDEVPQLINILIGDMSFVGTRPEVRKYVDNYSDEMKATLLMPAGVTSEASINFKDEDEIVNTYLTKGETVDEIYINRILPEKMKYNLEYVNNFTFLKDIKLSIKTVFAVLSVNNTVNINDVNNTNIEKTKISK